MHFVAAAGSCCWGDAGTRPGEEDTTVAGLQCWPIGRVGDRCNHRGCRSLGRSHGYRNPDHNPGCRSPDRSLDRSPDRSPDRNVSGEEEEEPAYDDAGEEEHAEWGHAGEEEHAEGEHVGKQEHAEGELPDGEQLCNPGDHAEEVVAAGSVLDRDSGVVGEYSGTLGCNSDRIPGILHTDRSPGHNPDCSLRHIDRSPDHIPDHILDHSTAGAGAAERAWGVVGTVSRACIVDEVPGLRVIARREVH